MASSSLLLWFHPQHLSVKFIETKQYRPKSQFIEAPTQLRMHFKGLFVVFAAVTGAFADCDGFSGCVKTCTCSCPGSTLVSNPGRGCAPGSAVALGVACPPASGPTITEIECDKDCDECPACPNTPTCRPDVGDSACSNVIERCGLSCDCAV